GFGKQQWYTGSRERVSERAASLQGALEFGQGKTGINREKCAFGISSLQSRGAFSALRAQPVAENSQKWSGLVTIGHVNRRIRTSQARQLPGLLDVPAQQDKKFRRAARCLITLRENISA